MRQRDEHAEGRAPRSRNFTSRLRRSYGYCTRRSGKSQGKGDTLHALLDHTMLEFYTEGFLREKGGTALGDLEQFFVFWHEHRDLLCALDKSQLSGIMIERATVLAQREKLMPMRILSWPADLQGLALSFAVCGLVSMVFQWYRQGCRLSPEELTEVAAAMLTKPLVNGG